MADVGFYDAGDPAAVDEAAKESARREREDIETFRIWMNHPKGRDLLYRLVYEVCHLGQTFVAADEAGRSDALRTYLHLGERNIGAFIDQRLRRHPELYMRMLAEQDVERDIRNQRLIRQNMQEDEIFDEHQN